MYGPVAEAWINTSVDCFAIAALTAIELTDLVLALILSLEVANRYSGACEILYPTKLHAVGSAQLIYHSLSGFRSTCRSESKGLQVRLNKLKYLLISGQCACEKRMIGLGRTFALGPVSYTHLRAHETR